MAEKSVLVVDDDKVMQMVLTKALTSSGFRVIAAESAEDALQFMTDTPAEVLVLDLNLPAMDGLQLCREIRKRWPWTIVIAITAYASVYELLACRDVGFEDYFVKPVDMEELVASVHNAFHKIDRWKKRWNGVRQQIIEQNQPPATGRSLL